jgi:hypothetical protein
MSNGRKYLDGLNSSRGGVMEAFRRPSPGPEVHGFQKAAALLRTPYRGINSLSSQYVVKVEARGRAQSILRMRKREARNEKLDYPQRCEPVGLHSQVPMDYDWQGYQIARTP